MSVVQKPPARMCGECGALNPGAATRCWLCRAAFRAPASVAEVAPSGYERRTAVQFSFATLLVTVAMLAVLLGVFRIAPGLSVLMGIIVVPAWLRTCIVVMSRRRGNKPVAFSEKAAVFAASVGVVAGLCVIAIAAVVAALSAVCGFIAFAESKRIWNDIGLVLILVFIGSSVVAVAGIALFVRRCRRL